uniref:Thioredoxin domain-containing protein 17 n=1 Tax=Pyxicephalus adspersus TaxID=30357 RepID=A0AAV3AYM0_PYXAD|nr:TPA: hypothetical protein GDO54_000860 [Pyxicephalus adspersus]
MAMKKYCNEVEKHKGSVRIVFALFCGHKDEKGVSWCTDCVKAEPVFQAQMKHLPEDSVFIYCLVNERTYWKHPTQDFKKNLKLTGVPTLVKVGMAQKLTEDDSIKPDLIQMRFSDD